MSDIFPEKIPGAMLGLGMAAFLVYLALSCMIQIKKKWWQRALLFAGCWMVSTSVIFIGDIINLTVFMLFFLTAMWISCEGSGLKRFTLGLMFSSTLFACNAFFDNSVGVLFYFLKIGVLHNYLYVAVRFLFALLLY
ncbi:MAG: hypothetical protein K2P30_16655, partial [Lachnospiraceae bacterium]|nr:hypothetical protein [Lachnospiraceae bacterium]